MTLSTFGLVECVGRCKCVNHRNATFLGLWFRHSSLWVKLQQVQHSIRFNNSPQVQQPLVLLALECGYQVLRFTIEVTHGLDTKNKFISGFTKQGMKFRPPTPHTTSSKRDSLNLEVDLPPHLTYIQLLWDMEDVYGVSKKLYWYLGAINTIELDDFIWEFNTWCDM